MKKPEAVLVLALLFFFVGGFLILVHIGVSGRKTQEISYGFSLRGASAAVSAYSGDFKRGWEVVKTKRAAFFENFFSGAAQAVPASGRAKAAQLAAGREGAADDYGEGDAFNKSYRDNYARRYGRSGGADGGFQVDMSGGESSTDGGGGLNEIPAQGASRKNTRKGADADAPVAPGLVPPPQGAAFGRPAAGGKSAAAARRYASLPGKNTPNNAAPNPGGQFGVSAEYGGKQPRKGGGVSGMGGNNPGGALDGAAEGMKAGAQSSYNAKMSGGAKAAASSGGSAPAVSGSKDASAGGKAGAAAAKTADTAAAKDSETNYAVGEDYADYPAGDHDLLSSVAADKNKNRDFNYGTDLVKGLPDDAELIPGAVVGDSAGVDDKDSSVAPADIDPADLTDLSVERSEELKKEIHTFLKKVENKHGKMNNDGVTRTSCDLTPEFCKENGVSGSYLTMTMGKAEKLVTLHLGMKYVKNKWRPYTIDLKAPAAAVRQPSE